MRGIDMHIARVANCEEDLFFSSMTIACSGAESCPYSEECPFIEGDLEPPVSKKCPVETYLVERIFNEYRKELYPKDGGNNNISVLAMLMDLTQAHIIALRAQKTMSRDGDVVQNVPVGITTDAQGVSRVVERPEVVKSLDVWERVLRVKMKLLDLLNATPKSQGGGMGEDPSTKAAKLIAKYEATKKQEEENASPIIDVESEKSTTIL